MDRYETQESRNYYRQKKYAESDMTIPYRLVGSYEYKKSLDSFTDLVSISTAEQLEVYDNILVDRPEFSFFNGANSAFGEMPDLKASNPFLRKQFQDDFLKKGLPWMMALARVELGATASLYGNSRMPFEDVATSQFDMDAYLHVLSDDIVAHMTSLSNEADFRDVLRRGRKIDTWTVAYLRRIKLIRDMLRAISKAGTPLVKARVEPFDKELEKHESRLLANIWAQTQSSTYARSNTTAGENKYRKVVTIKDIENCRSEVYK